MEPGPAKTPASSGAPGPPDGSAQLWGGRFEGGMDPAMVPLNRSLGDDFRLWPYDLRGSVAWARALGRAGVLTSDEVEALEIGLERVAARIRTLAESDAGPVPSGLPDEDVHSLVERLLFEEAGAVAGKLHTGRSRNDQVATDLKLWLRDRVRTLDHGLAGLARALADLARRGMDVILPGYTHLQQAQPVRASHWALSHAWPLVRDRHALVPVLDEALVLPLGSGAIAGCPFPIDREALARELGFEAASENSIDTVGDRDFLVRFALASALIGAHLSRLGEDLVLFASSEFGLLRLSDGFSTGSSLMPQKRNPDAPELARGKAGRLVGNAVALLTLIKGLPTGYNRDLQEDKAAAFDTADTLDLLLPALTGTISGVELDADRARERMHPELLATDLADHLVRAGVPFRTTHEIVGRLVRLAEERGCSLSELPDEEFESAHPALGPEARALFDWERSVEARSARGGTARAAVEVQLEALARRLAAQDEEIEERLA